MENHDQAQEHSREDSIMSGGVSRRTVLGAGASLMAASFLGMRPASAATKNYKFACALGWTSYDSGRHIQNGFKGAVKQLGGELNATDANFDAKKQSDQIDSFVASKPDALMIVPVDAVAIAPAVQRAVDARIPIFVIDSMIPGVRVNTTAIADNFGMGAYTATYIAKTLKGKGKICRVLLPQNESWDQRTLGAEWALRSYPGIEVVADWPFALTGNVTPRQAVDNLLTAHPDINAIWCAWDGAATAGALAVRAANRPDVIFTGIDGGTQAFQYIQAGSALKLTMAQSFYEEAFMAVYYAHQALAGKETPRLVISPAYAVTKKMLAKGIPDNYDVPGEAEKLGWTRAL